MPAANLSTKVLHILTTRRMPYNQQRALGTCTLCMHSHPLDWSVHNGTFCIHRWIYIVSLVNAWVNKWAGAHILPASVNFTSSPDPDLRLKRPRRNRYEADQIHILEVHKSFTNFPPLIDGFVHSLSLGSNREPQMMWVSIVV